MFKTGEEIKGEKTMSNNTDKEKLIEINKRFNQIKDPNHIKGYKNCSCSGCFKLIRQIIEENDPR